MITKRIIPCLDVKDGKVVKGTNFVDIKDAGNPVELASYYYQAGADELVFYDITASSEKRKLFANVLERTASKVFVPLMVGGGINSLEDFEIVLNNGADKVSVNSGAVRNPSLIDDASKRYGSQCVVLSVDAKRVDGEYMVFTEGGRNNSGKKLLSWIKEGVERGAGEIVLNSIDTDGVKKGFDLEMLSAVDSICSVPVIASGGAGKMEDFVTLFKSIPGISAGLAASIFHYGQVDISSLKQLLKREGIGVRI
jgi:cyclase